jgi:hypothetical protein
MRLPQALDWAVVRGQTEPPLGWYSPQFGAKLAIATLIGNGVAAGGDRMITDIRIELKEKARPGASHVDQTAVARTSGP